MSASVTESSAQTDTFHASLMLIGGTYVDSGSVSATWYDLVQVFNAAAGAEPTSGMVGSESQVSIDHLASTSEFKLMGLQSLRSAVRSAVSRALKGFIATMFNEEGGGGPGITGLPVNIGGLYGEDGYVRDVVNTSPQPSTSVPSIDPEIQQEIINGYDCP